MDLQQSFNQVGAAGADISEAHIGRGCRYQSQASHNPCVYGAGGTTPVRDNVWATILDATPPTVTAPTVHWDDWYLNASPGPYYPCAAPQAGEAPNPTLAFDSPVGVVSDTNANKLAYKNDNQGVVNLTPVELVSLQDRRRRDLLGLHEQGPHAPRHDLHRRQREGRHRRHGSLQGTGHDLHLGLVAREEHEALRVHLRRDVRPR